MNFKTMLKWWDEFFFKPRPVESIAAFRIFWFSSLLVQALLDFQNINLFYGPHALISLETVRDQFSFPHISFFQYFKSSYEFVYVIFGFYLVSLLFAIIGLYTRESIIVAMICLTSFHQRNIWLLSSSELLVRLVTLLMIFSPCGHIFSIDSIMASKKNIVPKKKDWAPWVLRLIQIQLSVVYLWTVWHKLKGETWFDGTAVYYATRLESMKNFSLPLLLDWIPFIKLSTWLTLVVELALGTLIWFKEFRIPMIFLGVIFHLSIEYIMSIPFFEINMIFILALFMPPEIVRTFIKTRIHFLRTSEHV